VSTGQEPFRRISTQEISGNDITNVYQLSKVTIEDLGRWQSLEMVQRYTRSVTFEDSLKFYKAPLG